MLGGFESIRAADEQKKAFPTIALTCTDDEHQLTWLLSITSSGNCALVKLNTKTKESKRLEFKVHPDYGKSLRTAQKERRFFDLLENYNANIPDNPEVKIFYAFENTIHRINIGWYLKSEYYNLTEEKKMDLKCIASIFKTLLRTLDGLNDEEIKFLKEELSARITNIDSKE